MSTALPPRNAPPADGAPTTPADAGAHAEVDTVRTRDVGSVRARRGRRRRPRRRRVEGLVAYAALVVSAASLFVAWRQTRVMDRQLAASVWPVLHYGTANADEAGQPVVALTLRNAGVGPAQVRSVRVSWAGRPVTSGRQLVQACCTGGDTARAFPWFARGPDGVLAAGEAADLLLVPRQPASAAVWEALDRARGRVVVRACYCSVLEDCWVVQSGARSSAGGGDGAAAERVASCRDEVAQPQYR